MNNSAAGNADSLTSWDGLVSTSSMSGPSFSSREGAGDEENFTCMHDRAQRNEETRHFSFAEHLVDESRPTGGGVDNTGQQQQQQQQHQQQNAPMPNSTTSHSNSVPADQERQLLLLMLLAQVCALHDPTPRTFTVHVLELFERGLLDRTSIHFLYDLGLVPAPPAQAAASAAATTTRTTTLLLHAAETTPPPPVPSHLMDSEFAGSNESATSHHVLAVVPTAGLITSNYRSMEASAIRTSLERHEKLRVSSDHRDAAIDPGNNNSPGSPPSERWSVDAHPLSLSRYQREFTQVGLLASGGFGEVFQATNKMDGHDYAIKRVCFAARGYSRDSVQQVIREVHCLAVCDHPNVVRYYTSWLEPSWMTGSSTSHEGSRQRARKEHKMITGFAVRSRDVNGFSEDVLDLFRDANWTQRGHSLSFDLESSGDSGSEASEWTIEQKQSKDDFYVGGDMKSRSTTHRYDDRARTRSSPQQHKYSYQICLFIQMQLCHPSSLADWIRNRNSNHSGRLSHDNYEIATKIFSQITQGLVHIHSKGIVHRDLKPANIFVATAEDDCQFKIGDFGLSKLIESAQAGTQSRVGHGLLLASETASPTGHASESHGPYSTSCGPMTTGLGTASYAAPEQVSSPRYGTEADVFSMGLILLELLCRFSTEHERLQVFHECRHKRRLPNEIEAQYATAAHAILACTEPVAAKRPTAMDLLRLDLLQDVRKASERSKEDVIRDLQCQLVLTRKKLQECSKDLLERDMTIAELRYQLDVLRNRLGLNQGTFPALGGEEDSLGPASSSSTSEEEL